MGLVESRCPETKSIIMNNNFISHIIRDIFPVRNNIVLYGDLHELKKEMQSPAHSMGSFMLHTDRSRQEYEENSAYWELGFNSPYMGYNYADLFISINYEPELLSDNYEFMAEQIKSILKPNGFLLLINPSSWCKKIKNYLKINNNLIDELQRYSILKNEQVFVYENI